MKAAKMIADVLKHRFRFDSVSIMQTSGIFQDVPHFHVHVFGRSEKQDLTIRYPEGVDKSPQRLHENALLIKEAIDA